MKTKVPPPDTARSVAEEDPAPGSDKVEISREHMLSHVYVHDSLQDQRGVSQEIIGAAEQLRSFPEGFMLIRQPLRA